MLVLTRKPNQQLQIGTDIVITVVKVRGNTIRLGIEAPRDVRVIRSELEPKQAGGKSSGEKPDSASSSGSDDAAVIVAELGCTLLSDSGSTDAPASQVEAGGPSTGGASIGQSPATAPRAAKRSPLGSFTAAKHAKAPRADRNLEDSPLCHSPIRSNPMHIALHSERVAKSTSGRQPTKPRAPLSGRAASPGPSSIALALATRS